MQGCGGRRRIYWWASCCFLEYGVQCLPLALKHARDGPDRIYGYALKGPEFKYISEPAISGVTAELGRITSGYCKQF
jgi:hypothetical protein